ncbi:MAG: hypothetical protein C4305_05500 [Thermoleophilia bacterium]
MLSGLRGDRRAREACREHGISEALFSSWRDQLLEAGKKRFAGTKERAGGRELRRTVAQLERALGRTTYELEIAGDALRGLKTSERVARSCELVATGLAVAAVARVMPASRQGLFGVPAQKAERAGPALAVRDRSSERSSRSRRSTGRTATG